jgi:hypothetical protein
MSQHKHERAATNAAKRLLQAVDRMSKAAKDAAHAKDDLDRATRLRLHGEGGTNLSLNDGGGNNRGK